MLKSVLSKMLYQIANDLDSGVYQSSDEEVSTAISQLAQFDTARLSKAQACDYLGISRSTFDDRVRRGILPKGQKIQGFKELSWLKEELDAAKEQYPAKFKIKFNYTFDQEL